MREHFCETCKVSVENDLRYCPLCGKFVLKDETAKAEECPNSYPIYDLSYIYRAKWLKIVRDVLWFIAALVVSINLIFGVEFLWFPYVLVGIFVLWKTIFFPFKEGENHIKRIPISGLIIALALIFIDVYDHIVLGTEMGWAIVFAGPAVGAATVGMAFILSLCNPNYDVQLIRGIVYLVAISSIVFILRVFIFTSYAIWPTFMFFVSACASLFILLVSKRRRMVKEINRNFHI